MGTQTLHFSFKSSSKILLWCLFWEPGHWVNTQHKGLASSFFSWKTFWRSRVNHTVKQVIVQLEGEISNNCFQTVKLSSLAIPQPWDSKGYPIQHQSKPYSEQRWTTGTPKSKLSEPVTVFFLTFILIKHWQIARKSTLEKFQSTCLFN